MELFVYGKPIIINEHEMIICNTIQTILDHHIVILTIVEIKKNVVIRL